MGLQDCFDGFFSCAVFLFAPHIDQDSGLFGYIEATFFQGMVVHGVGVPVIIEGGWFVGSVEEQEGHITIAQCPDQDIYVVKGHVFEAGMTEAVLVDGQRLRVAQNVPVGWTHRSQVVAGHQWSGHHAPNGHMRAVFGFCLVAVAYLQHFQVVPMTRAGGIGYFHGFVKYLQEAYATPVEGAIEAIPDIGGDTPEVSDAFAPFPGLVFSPFADAQHDGTSTGFERVTHGLVCGSGVLAFVGTPVVFQVVYAPFSVLPGILKLVTAAAWTPLTGPAAGAGVDAEFESFAVNVIGQRFHAIWKMRGVGHDVAHGIAAHLPAVVDDDVFVAGLFHACCHHGIGHFLDKGFADLAAKFIPTVPAHGWSGSQLVECRRLGVNQTADE